MLLNKKPIFIIGFARGGSNILLNLLRSHPDLCSPRGELQEVFKGKSTESLYTKARKLMDYAPILLRERRDIFSLTNWKPRSGLTDSTKVKIDKVLFYDKFKATLPSQNLYKTESVKYTHDEIAASRLLSKNLNGLIFLTPELQKMYPDATFIALVRNGLAVVEGHMRRGYSLEEFSAHYETGCQQIIQDAKQYPNYHIVRYEDMIANPDPELANIYRIIDLDIELIKKIRLETKKVIGKDGSHDFRHQTSEKKVIWYDRQDYFKHFMPNANQNQINRLSQDQRDRIKEICKRSLDNFDYA